MENTKKQKIQYCMQYAWNIILKKKSILTEKIFKKRKIEFFKSIYVFINNFYL